MCPFNPLSRMCVWSRAFRGFSFFMPSWPSSPLFPRLSLGAQGDPSRRRRSHTHRSRDHTHIYQPSHNSPLPMCLFPFSPFLQLQHFSLNSLPPPLLPLVSLSCPPPLPIHDCLRRLAGQTVACVHQNGYFLYRLGRAVGRIQEREREPQEGVR